MSETKKAAVQAQIVELKENALELVNGGSLSYPISPIEPISPINPPIIIPIPTPVLRW